MLLMLSFPQSCSVAPFRPSVLLCSRLPTIQVPGAWMPTGHMCLLPEFWLLGWGPGLPDARAAYPLARLGLKAAAAFS